MLAWLFWAVALLLLSTIALKVSWRYWKSSWQLDFIPGAKSFPWIGTLMDTDRLVEFFDQMHAISDNRFKMWLGPTPVVSTGRVEDIAPILRSNTLLSRSYILEMLLKPWLGESIVMTTNDKWRHRRKLLTPAFHFGILKEYARIFERYSGKLCVDIQKVTENGIQSIDVQPLLAKWTLHIINETAMGLQVDGAEYSHYIDALGKVKELVMERWVRPWLYPEFIFKLSSRGRSFYKNLETINTFIVSAINRKIEERKGSEKKTYRTFLDVLLDAYDENHIDVKALLDEVNTFMFAGHETTSTALSWVFYQLGLHPDIQQKLYDAIKEHMNLTAGGELFERYGNIDYLERVIKETLRMNTPVLQYDRMLTEDTTLVGHRYLKGVEISISAEAAHYNKDYWNDPQLFDPDRFKHVPEPFTFIPFSAGPRNCIGQKFAMWEMRIIICSVIMRYRVVTPPQKPNVCIDITRVSRNGLWINFEERKMNSFNDQKI